MQKTTSEKTSSLDNSIAGGASSLTEKDLPGMDARSSQILRERARALAVEASAGLAQTGDVLDIVRFEFGGQHFGLESHFVVQVTEFGEIVPLPSTPDFLVGLVNVRGRILPVYNLLRILGFAEPGISDAHQILHVRADEIDICLLADKINAAESLLISALQPPVQNGGANAAKFVRGITAEQLVILDFAAIMASSALVVDH